MWPPLAAALIVLESHGQPLSSSHSKTSSVSHLAAPAHVLASQIHPFACSHCKASMLPPSAAKILIGALGTPLLSQPLQGIHVPSSGLQQIRTAQLPSPRDERGDEWPTTTCGRDRSPAKHHAMCGWQRESPSSIISHPHLLLPGSSQVALAESRPVWRMPLLHWR